MRKQRAQIGSDQRGNGRVIVWVVIVMSLLALGTLVLCTVFVRTYVVQAF